jgi:hypothetical protein
VSLEALTPGHLAVFLVLRQRNIVTALHYLRAVLPGTPFRDLTRFLADYQPPPPPLAPDTYATLLERPLTDRERTAVTTLADLLPEQRDLARRLARDAHRVVALIYLRRMAPASPAEDCERMVDELVR